MAVSLLECGVSAPVKPAELQVRRRDIRFGNVDRNRLRISVTVASGGSVSSQPTVMFLQAAPFGAFLPWRDLTSILVPPIGPYEAIEVTTEVAIPPVRVLGDFSRVPPRRLLTAIGGDDEPSEETRSPNSFATDLWTWVRDRLQSSRDSRLPVDPLSLLSRPNVHWAGNINVLIGGRSVERHLAQALRIYAGRTNLALFFVGDRADEYRFELAGSGVAWSPALFDLSDARSLVECVKSSDRIPDSRWVKMSGCRMVVLAVEPPEECEAGDIEVHVRQRSTGREAVVEFSLDPSAAGAGCYAV